MKRKILNKLKPFISCIMLTTMLTSLPLTASASGLNSHLPLDGDLTLEQIRELATSVNTAEDLERFYSNLSIEDIYIASATNELNYTTLSDYSQLGEIIVNKYYFTNGEYYSGSSIIFTSSSLEDLYTASTSDKFTIIDASGKVLNKLKINVNNSNQTVEIVFDEVLDGNLTISYTGIIIPQFSTTVPVVNNLPSTRKISKITDLYPTQVQEPSEPSQEQPTSQTPQPSEQPVQEEQTSQPSEPLEPVVIEEYHDHSHIDEEPIYYNNSTGNSIQSGFWVDDETYLSSSTIDEEKETPKIDLSSLQTMAWGVATNGYGLQQQALQSSANINLSNVSNNWVTNVNTLVTRTVQFSPILPDPIVTLADTGITPYIVTETNWTPVILCAIVTAIALLIAEFQLKQSIKLDKQAYQEEMEESIRNKKEINIDGLDNDTF